MSNLVARIMLAILLFPLAGTLYFVTFIVWIEGMSRGWSRDNVNLGFTLAGLTSWAFMAGYWFLLWRKSIRWTDTRITLTVACFIGAAVIGGALGAMIYALEDELGFFVGTIIAPLLWQVGATLAWRETPAERGERTAAMSGAPASGAGGADDGGTGGGTAIVCPTCGYNMTGLRGTRCPECGSEFTIDQLFAGQPGRAAAELEA